jgi:hypothetical protein
LVHPFAFERDHSRHERTQQSTLRAHETTMLSSVTVRTLRSTTFAMTRNARHDFSTRVTGKNCVDRVILERVRAHRPASVETLDESSSITCRTITHRAPEQTGVVRDLEMTVELARDDRGECARNRAPWLAFLGASAGQVCRADDVQ